MKKALFTLVIVLLSMAAQAQIKVHNDGQISLGSLTTNYGVQVRSDGYTTFRTQYSTNGSWAILSYSNHNYQKHWIIDNHPNNSTSGTQTFFVYGNGLIYSSGDWTRSDSNDMLETSNIENAGAVLDSITGIWYNPLEEDCEEKAESNRRIGVRAQEVEKFLPEAVSTDESGLFYVNYNALTVFLIEAVKEQRQEIELLRKTLEENGLLEPEKQ